MDAPKIRANGKPVCSEQICYLIYQAGGKMKRGEIHKELKQMGYQGYCILEAFTRLERQNLIKYEGSSKSVNQIVFLNDNYNEEGA